MLSVTGDPPESTRETVAVETPASAATSAIVARRDGVDGIFIGPSDLAAGYGHLGQPSHPEVQAAMARVFECARQHGKPVGILAPVDADARRYLELGASFVAVGSDLGVFRQATQALRDKFV